MEDNENLCTTSNEQGDPADHFKKQADVLLKLVELRVPILEKIVEMIVTREFWCPRAFRKAMETYRYRLPIIESK